MKTFEEFLNESTLTSAGQKINQQVKKEIDKINKDIKASHLKLSYKIKQEDNFLTIFIKYFAGAGVTSIGGQDTLTGSDTKESAKLANAIGNKLIDWLDTNYNLEDTELTDEGNGTYTVWSVSDDYTK